MSDKDEIMQQVAPEKDVNAVENEIVESAKATQNESVENTANEVVEVQSQEENNTENVQKNDENCAKNGVKNKKKFKLGTVGKCTLVLVVIAVVAGILLGVVNWLTYVNPDSVIIQKCATEYQVSADNVSKNEDRECMPTRTPRISSSPAWRQKTGTETCSDIAIIPSAQAQKTAR